MKRYIVDDRIYLESQIERITESGCWIWVGGLTSEGYGQTWRRNGESYAHRLSYRIFIGPIPTGYFVCHTCDVKSCCNPSHMFLGTSDDNIADMLKKERNPKGEKHGCAILTEKQILDIRKDCRNGEAIARSYGVSRTHVHRIKKKQVWKHI